MLCKIADVLVEIPAVGDLTDRCQAYLCDQNAPPDMILDGSLPPKEKWPDLSEDLRIYLATGFRFSRDLLKFGGFYLHGFRYPDSNHKRFQRDTSKFCSCRIYIHATPQQDSDLSGASAVNRYVQIPGTDTEIVQRSGTLHGQQILHFLYALPEHSRLGIEVQRIISEVFLVQTDGQGYSQRISVFQSHSTFDDRSWSCT